MKRSRGETSRTKREFTFMCKQYNEVEKNRKKSSMNHKKIQNSPTISAIINITQSMLAIINFFLCAHASRHVKRARERERNHMRNVRNIRTTRQMLPKWKSDNSFFPALVCYLATLSIPCCLGWRRWQWSVNGRSEKGRKSYKIFFRRLIHDFLSSSKCLAVFTKGEVFHFI